MGICKNLLLVPGLVFFALSEAGCRKKEENLTETLSRGPNASSMAGGTKTETTGMKNLQWIIDFGNKAGLKSSDLIPLASCVNATRDSETKGTVRSVVTLMGYKGNKPGTITHLALHGDVVGEDGKLRTFRRSGAIKGPISKIDLAASSLLRTPADPEAMRRAQPKAYAHLVNSIAVQQQGIKAKTFDPHSDCFHLFLTFQDQNDTFVNLGVTSNLSANTGLCDNHLVHIKGISSLLANQNPNAKSKYEAVGGDNVADTAGQNGCMIFNKTALKALNTTQVDTKLTLVKPK